MLKQINQKIKSGAYMSDEAKKQIKTKNSALSKNKKNVDEATKSSQIKESSH